MYARPRFEDGATTTFGVSGKLWRDALVMYDRKSRSLWSQVDGYAKAGPLRGQKLVKIPSQVTTWSAWKQRHPGTLVLAKPALEGSAYASYFEKSSWVGLPWTRGAGDDRLEAKTLVIGVEITGVEVTGVEVAGVELGDAAALAVELEHLRREKLLSGETMGLPVLVVAPRDPRAAQAYLRQVGDRLLDFELSVLSEEGERLNYLTDRQTGSRWHWETGEALEGPLAGERLTALPTTPIYWATWATFHPQTLLWQSVP